MLSIHIGRKSYILRFTGKLSHRGVWDTFPFVDNLMRSHVIVKFRRMVKAILLRNTPGALLFITSLAATYMMLLGRPTRPTLCVGYRRRFRVYRGIG